MAKEQLSSIIRTERPAGIVGVFSRRERRVAQPGDTEVLQTQRPKRDGEYAGGYSKVDIIHPNAVEVSRFPSKSALDADRQSSSSYRKNENVRASGYVFDDTTKRYKKVTYRYK